MATIAATNVRDIGQKDIQGRNNSSTRIDLANIADVPYYVESNSSFIIFFSLYFHKIISLQNDMSVQLIMVMSYNMKKYLSKIFMKMVRFIFYKNIILFSLKYILDKEDSLDALIRNVKDQQRESQVITTSVCIYFHNYHLKNSIFLFYRLPVQFLVVP